MITYVNTVFVSNVGTVAETLAGATKGQLFFLDVDTNAAATAATTRFKIGMATGKTLTANGATTKEFKWSNIINVADIKGWADHTNAGDTEDVVNINFRSLDSAVLTNFAKGGKRIIVRLTFKDLPTRFRKWTESYEYVTKIGDTANSIVRNIVDMINKEAKRARVVASLGTAAAGSNAGDPDTISATASGSEANANTIVLTAMKYDDDNSVDSLNWYEKVRFNANLYFTDPAAEGWESVNKHFPKGVEITKTPGKTDLGSAKLVRDREAQAMGYLGILNRGEGTWPVIKPAMETNLSNTYNVVTLEFENTYRAADDIFRKTKQTVEIYTTGATSAITSVLATLVGTIVDKTIDKD